METQQDPLSSNPNPPISTSITNNGASIPPPPPPHHRRAHSDLTFRIISDDMDLSSIEDLGSEDDVFNTYIDVHKLGSDLRGAAGDCGDGSGGGGDGERNGSLRPRHRYSNSVDASSSGGSGSELREIMDAKKAMPPDKLAELWSVDPKRAKRILANRQSAARSKERKARYIVELEQRVQTLQTEATTLSAQLNLYQRDTTGLSTENTELKLRLQAMEQQAQLRDALNEALKQEVERLRVATGETTDPSESFNLGMTSMSFNPSTNTYSFPQQHFLAGQQTMQMPPFHHFEPNIPPHIHPSNPQHFSELFQNDPLGRLQGLDIGSRGLHAVKSEESSSTF